MKRLIRILFVCHGNICRSPMAEFIFKDIVRRNGKENDFYIKSAATSTEELGNPVYPPAKAELARHGLSCEGKRSVQITKEDYNRYDYIFIMDGRNERNIRYIVGDDREGKIHKLLDFAGMPGDVPDPWYTGNFDEVYNSIFSACEKIFKKLK